MCLLQFLHIPKILSVLTCSKDPSCQHFPPKLPGRTAGEQSVASLLESFVQINKPVCFIYFSTCCLQIALFKIDTRRRLLCCSHHENTRVPLQSCSTSWALYAVPPPHISSCLVVNVRKLLNRPNCCVSSWTFLVSTCKNGFGLVACESISGQRLAMMPQQFCT